MSRLKLYIAMIGELSDPDVRFVYPRDDQDMDRYLAETSEEEKKPVSLFLRMRVAYPGTVLEYPVRTPKETEAGSQKGGE